jgi:hypothetical protein
MLGSGYLWVYVMFSVIAVTTVLIVGAAAALRAANPVAAGEVRAGVRWVASLLVIWVLVAIALAYSGDFVPLLAQQPPLKLAVGMAIAAVFGLLFLTTRTGVRVVRAIPQSWIVGAQVYRGLGSIFLVYHGLGMLPGEFALPAGFGDVTVGLLAVPIATLYAANASGSRGLVTAWNILGMTDLTVAVTMGVLTSTQLVHTTTPATLVGEFPLVMIPFYAVPLSFVLHIASLMKLRWERVPALNVAAA